MPVIGPELVIPFTVGEAGESERPPSSVAQGIPEVAGNRYRYFAYDLLTAKFIGQIPLRGVSFGQQLNTPGSMSGTIDLQDPLVQTTLPLRCTVPNRTFIVVDYEGTILWGGIVMTRDWQVDSSGQSTTRQLEVQCAELWTYFQQRVQATDYSAPPTSGIETPMTYWKETPWDASLIACQIIADAVGNADSKTEPHGNPLNGIVLHLNSEAPSGSHPAASSADYVAVNYPFPSMQSVDAIVTQLSQLGLGVGFDFGVDLAYSAGSGSAPVATVNISYPRRGRTVEQNHLLVDLTTARKYRFPEDGSQTANRVYELGGSGAIVVDENVNPLEQGYPVWERVISRASIQSQNITSILTQTGLSDLALYSYPPVVPTFTLGAQDANLPLGSFIVGDDIQLILPEVGPDGHVFDPRFPNGLNQEWRITGWKATVSDQGDATVEFTINQPPYEQALAPAV